MCNPRVGSPPGSLGFSRQEYWSGLPFPSPMHESESEVAQSRPTLSDLMDCSLPGSSTHGLSRQEYWSGVPLPSLLKVTGNAKFHYPSPTPSELFLPNRTFFHNGGVLTFWQLSIKTEEEESEEKEASAAEEEEEEEKKTGGGGEKTVRGGGRGGKEKISFSSMILACLYRYLQTKVI